MFGKHHRHGHRPEWSEEQEWSESSRAQRGPHHSGPHHGGPHWHEHRPGPGFRGRFGPRGPFGFMPHGGPRFDRPFGGGGPFGGDPFDEGGGGGGRRRQRRGDLKYVLLELLAEQPRHGYDLIKELEQRYAGFYRPSPGSVYPTLQLLEDEGNLTSEQVEGKRVYTITEAGRSVLAERQQQPGDQPGGWRHGGRRGPAPELEELRRSAMALMSSVMQGARHGTPDQQRAVQERLEATRREIYRILAGDQSANAE